MDGTLTPPREKISMQMIDALKDKSSEFDIGIVTGSDYDYVVQQCADLFGKCGVSPLRLHLFPCNGTKAYYWKYTQYDLCYSADMIKKIGSNTYRKILSAIFDRQSEIALFYPDVPLTGTFFQYRGSLLNWCPIGRIANLDQRAAWKKLDSSYKIREEYMSQLQKVFAGMSSDICVALGGSTSFDIYPSGWDKTYVMKHLDDYDRVYFVGDKCREGGNDKALYDLLAPEGRSFETTSPDETIKILSKIIL